MEALNKSILDFSAHGRSKRSFGLPSFSTAYSRRKWRYMTAMDGGNARGLPGAILAHVPRKL
jgi:hypothetical protein